MRLSSLKKRLIPKLLINHRQIGAKRRPILVTTKQFKEQFDVGDAVSQAKIYEAQLADELIVLNISGLSTHDDDEVLALVERLASETFMPLTVGGGVRTLADFASLLEHGADKVCINSAAIASPELIRQAAMRFGAQCVVVSIDFYQDDKHQAWVFEGHDKPASLPLEAWVKTVVEAGAGEILLTDVTRDGEGRGLNTAIGRQVSDSVVIPVILSGGCGLIEHFVEGFQASRIEAVAAGTFFNFRDQNFLQLRAHLLNEGIPLRVNT